MTSTGLLPIPCQPVYQVWHNFFSWTQLQYLENICVFSVWCWILFIRSEKLHTPLLGLLSWQVASNNNIYDADLMTEDSTLLCSASDTVCRAMASLAAICFFFRLFRLWDGDHSCFHTDTGLPLQRLMQTKTQTELTGRAAKHYSTTSRHTETKGSGNWCDVYSRCSVKWN